MSTLWISLVVGLLASGGSSAALAARQQTPTGPVPSPGPAAAPASEATGFGETTAFGSIQSA